LASGPHAESSPLFETRTGSRHDPRALLSEDAAELLATSPRLGLRALLYGLVIVVAGAGAWGSLTRLETRVVAEGALVVVGEVSVLRAATSGVLGRVNAREGDGVAPGMPIFQVESREPTLAPVDATVARVSHAAGDRVETGEPIVVIIPKTSRLEALARVPRSASASVRAGQRVHVRFPSGARLPSAGSVRGLEGSVVDATLGVCDRVSITLEDPSLAGALPGLPVTVEIVTGETTPLGWLLAKTGR
jgi:multidrug efflux pump subunit AcrA (membrane-fusion protein)